MVVEMVREGCTYLHDEIAIITPHPFPQTIHHPVQRINKQKEREREIQEMVSGDKMVCVCVAVCVFI